MQPKIGEVARAALAFVAGIAGGLLSLIGAFIIGGIFIAFGEPGARVCRRIFARVVGEQRGDEFTSLSAATIRAVAQGVVGVAVIQAIIIGLCLLVAGVPWAGAIAGIVLILGIAQIPAVIVTLPAIAYIWSVGTYGSVAAVLYTVLLLVAGMADNVLKPLMLRSRRRRANADHSDPASAEWRQRASSACSSARRCWPLPTRCSQR